MMISEVVRTRGGWAFDTKLRRVSVVHVMHHMMDDVIPTVVPAAGLDIRGSTCSSWGITH